MYKRGFARTTARGFTLIELLVVIAIIGILSGIVVVGLNDARVSARDARRIADIKNIQVALSLYYNDNGHYPCRLDDSGQQGNTACQPQFSGNYLSVIPSDPLGNPYVYTALQQSGVPGLTCTLNNGGIRSYHLGIALETTSQTGHYTQDNTFTISGSGVMTISGQSFSYCSPGEDNFHHDFHTCTRGDFTSGSSDTCYSVGP